MNHLADFKVLKNRYFTLRHGEATCNVLRILISHFSNGGNDFGLTETGKQRIKEVMENQKFLNDKTVIYSSDFLRTKETAEIAREVLSAPAIHLDARLRERYFGDFEKMDYDYYKLVWAKDNTDNAQKEHQVESILEVQDRVTGLVADLEKQYSGQSILLVSHGDPLQFLEASFNASEPFNHHNVIMPHKGELRELIFNSIATLI